MERRCKVCKCCFLDQRNHLIRKTFLDATVSYLSVEISQVFCITQAALHTRLHTSLLASSNLHH